MPSQVAVKWNQEAHVRSAMGPIHCGGFFVFADAGDVWGTQRNGYEVYDITPSKGRRRKETYSIYNVDSVIIKSV